MGIELITPMKLIGLAGSISSPLNEDGIYSHLAKD